VRNNVGPRVYHKKADATANVSPIVLNGGAIEKPKRARARFSSLQKLTRRTCWHRQDDGLFHWVHE